VAKATTGSTCAETAGLENRKTRAVKRGAAKESKKVALVARPAGGAIPHFF